MTLAILPINFLLPRDLCKLEKSIVLRSVVTQRQTTNFLNLMPLDDVRRRSRSTVAPRSSSCHRNANEAARSKSQSREARPIHDDGVVKDCNNNNNDNGIFAMQYLESSTVKCDDVAASHWKDKTDEQTTRGRGERSRRASFPAIPDNQKRKLSRSCMSIPDTTSHSHDGMRESSQLPHLYTPYFYLPHQTSYQNDQDLVIVNQPLDEMFLRANYFELKQLARAGFDFRTSDCHCNTPLHYAAKRGDASIVRLVMSEGGSAWARNSDHRTPFELASNLATAMVLADATLFYGETVEKGHLEKIKVCYEL